jgi:hypothetical protein
MCNVVVYDASIEARVLGEMSKAETACTFYVAGVVNMILFPGVADAMDVCIPKNMTMPELRLSVERLMRSSPDQFSDYSAAFAIMDALRRNYPCKQTTAARQ